MKYGSGSYDNVMPARPTAGMHAAVKPETDAQLHARLTAAVRERYCSSARVRVYSEDGVTFVAHVTRCGTKYIALASGQVDVYSAESQTYGGALRALETKINQK